MDKFPNLQIVVDSDLLVLKGFGAEATPTTLSGHLILRLNEPMAFREIALDFKGRAVVPSVDDNSPADSYEMCTHRWIYLKSEGTDNCTLDAGRHVYPFDICIEGTLPSSITTRHSCKASVSYRLNAVAVRPGFAHNLQARLPVHITRLLPPEELEYQQTLETEATWMGKLMYSVSIPHKAWAAGDTLIVLAKMSPMTKRVKLTSVRLDLKKLVKVWTSAGWQETRHTVVSKTHDLRPQSGRHASIALHRIASALSSRATRPTHDVVAVGEAARDIISIDGEISPSDVVALLELPLPATLPPTHFIEPIKVSYRLHWAISITSLTGHVYEQWRSIPLHILDHRLLDETMAATVMTRRLFLGLDSTEEEHELPSYSSHVRDRVACVEYDGSLVEVRNPWASPLVPDPEHSSVSASHQPVSPASSSPSTSPPFPRHSSGPVPTPGPSSHNRSPKKHLREWLHRSSSRTSHEILVRSPPRFMDRHMALSDAPSPLAALSEVPTYDATLRGFSGGVPPLESIRSLPNYF
ncbi:hypothetical protein OF83DRAFT_612179 [Amylostereum chailletii]|nr:hypothetical protein OF83DRAFT_612179 [Amylostereum chailletii]